jgi:hypothetical protein
MLDNVVAPYSYYTHSFDGSEIPFADTAQNVLVSSYCKETRLFSFFLQKYLFYSKFNIFPMHKCAGVGQCSIDIFMFIACCSGFDVYSTVHVNNCDQLLQKIYSAWYINRYLVK